jgi:hypothetical protein
LASGGPLVQDVMARRADVGRVIAIAKRRW